jgi:hypothetical protein
MAVAIPQALSLAKLQDSPVVDRDFQPLLLAIDWHQLAPKYYSY